MNSLLKSKIYYVTLLTVFACTRCDNNNNNGDSSCVLIDDVDMMVTTIIQISVALTMRLCVDFCGGESYSVGLCWVLLLLDFLPLCVVSCGHCASREGG
jgi:hypothetical protein